MTLPPYTGGTRPCTELLYSIMPPIHSSIERNETPSKRNFLLGRLNSPIARRLSASLSPPAALPMQMLPRSVGWSVCQAQNRRNTEIDLTPMPGPDSTARPKCHVRGDDDRVDVCRVDGGSPGDPRFRWLVRLAYS